jgi:hypothetical protein
MNPKIWKYSKLSESGICMILVISVVISMVELYPVSSIGQKTGELEQKSTTTDVKSTTTDVNFNSPQNNIFSLGRPFLVQYDNTTSVKPIGSATLDNFDVTFDGTVKYNDNGTGIFITNPDDGTVYQKGVIELRTENGNDSIKTTYESIGVPIRQQNPDRHFLFDSGIMFFNVSSNIGGELSFLNNKVGVYKDMLDRDKLNLTTIAWEWN